MITQSAIKLNGSVYVGKRHHNIIFDLSKSGIKPHGGIQGFVTDKGEFLNRTEAKTHFIECGQKPIKGDFHHQTELFSEDLY